MFNKNNFYFQTLLNSWKIVWKTKILWFFALFSLFLGSEEWNGFLSFNFSDFLKKDGLVYNFSQLFLSKGILKNLLISIEHDPFYFLFLIFIFIFIAFIFIAFIYIGVVFQGSLIYSIFKVNLKQKINVHESLTIGRNNFWQILSLNIIIKFIVYGLSFLLTFFSLVSFLKKTTLNLLIFSLFSIFIILFLFLLSFVFRYALAYIILKGKDNLSAIKESFILFFKNWVINLEVAFFLFIINYIFLFLAIWIIKIMTIPFSSLGSFSLFLSSGVSFDFYFVFIPILISLFILVFFTIISAYNYCVWTTLFLKLNNSKKMTSLTKSFFLKLKKKINYGKR